MADYTDINDVSEISKEEQADFDRHKKRRAGKIDESVGNSVRYARMLLGITQAQLAKEIGITFQQLQKYENGFNRISAATLCLLSRVLKVPVSNFFPAQKIVKKAVINQNKATISSGQQPSTNDKEIGNLLEMYSKINSPKTKQKILLLLEELSNRY